MGWKSWILTGLLFTGLAGRSWAADPDLFARENLVAWCIVPFDSAKRGPEARAQMLDELGIRQLAYDWRGEHIPQFDEEVETLQKHGIKLTAWWVSPADS